MSKLKIYHGSKIEISKPLKSKGKQYNDYGQGFYCTEFKDVAGEWACRFKEDGIVNEYEIETNELDLLVVDESHHILNWLAILAQNREFTNRTVINNAEYIIDKYTIDYKKFDIIIGYRADDQYYMFVREFLSGLIGLNTLKEAMYLGEYGLQVFVQSERAFSKLKFIESYEVDQEEYFLLNENKGKEANEKYDNLKEKNEIEDVYIRDIKGGELDESVIPKIKIK